MVSLNIAMKIYLESIQGTLLKAKDYFSLSSAIDIGIMAKMKI